MEVVDNFFEEKDQEQVKKIILDVIRQLASNFDNKLNLENLEYLIVPVDYGSELLKFQREHGLTEGYTNDEYGQAFGKNLSYEKDGKLKTSIFIDSAIIQCLFMEEQRQMSVHLIHHELCHTHDATIKVDMLGLDNVLRSRGDFQTVLRIHADNIWSEYFANRWASKTIPVDHDMYVLYLVEMVNKIKETNEKFIKEYRLHGNIDQLYGEIQMYTAKLLYTAATVYGYIHGRNLGQHEFKKLLDETINETYMRLIWGKLENQLEKLYDIYGFWSGIEQLNGLSSIVLKMWNNMGIFPSVDKNGALYIDVP